MCPLTSVKRQPLPSLGIALAAIVLAFEVPFVAVDMFQTHGSSAGLQGTLSPPSKSPFDFSPSFDELVGMRVDYTSHYQYDTAEGAAEFAALVPPSGHVVYVDIDGHMRPQKHTVTLFHQLECLEVIRAQYANPADARLPLTNHCLNYLRQTVLCFPNIRMEPATNSEGTAVRGYDAVCRDWTQVYAEAERNVDAYRAWSNATIKA